MKFISIFFILILNLFFLNFSKATEEVDVIIIGAGISGITAARDLIDKNFNVIILEADIRVGGRIDTQWGPDLSKFPHPVEMGGAWVHEEYINPLYPILQAANIPMTIFNQDDSSIWRNGHLVGFNQLLKMLNKADYIWNNQSTPYRLSGKSDADALMNSGYMFDDNEVETYFQFAYEQWVGNNLEYHDSVMWDHNPSNTGPDRIVDNGYSSILDYFIDKTPSFRSNIKLSSPVIKIDYSSPSKKVTVTYQNNGVNKEIRAIKGVIVTPSINVLKSNTIEMIPPLPSSYTNALNKLMCSEVDKVALFFDDIGTNLLSSANLAHNYMFRYGRGTMPRINDALTCFINWKHFNGQGVVTSFFMGDYARTLENMADIDIVNKHMTALREFIPDLPNPIHTIITRWGKHPWTRCSYTDFAVGGTLSDLNQMSIPLPPYNNVVFAGEASNFPNQGTVHGAYQSGLQAAQKISSLST